MESISILIVEDEVIVAMDLANRLARLGFKIIGKAASGTQAVSLFETEKPDLVLMDINLKGALDGIQTVEKMMHIQRVPFIYLTAQTDTVTFERAKSTAPSAYLTKPFDEKNLQLAIELAIHNFAVQKHPLSISGENKEKMSLETAQNDDEKIKSPSLPTADNILKTDNAVFIKQNYRFVKFQPDDLLFVQADGAYSDLITCHHKHTLRLTLTQVLERLRMPNLVRTHRSYAVNLKNVVEFSEAEIVVGKHTIPIGTSYKEGFLRQFDFL